MSAPFLPGAGYQRHRLRDGRVLWLHQPSSGGRTPEQWAAILDGTVPRHGIREFEGRGRAQAFAADGVPYRVVVKEALRGGAVRLINRRWFFGESRFIEDLRTASRAVQIADGQVAWGAVAPAAILLRRRWCFGWWVAAHIAVPEIPDAHDLILLASESRGEPRERFAIARAAGEAIAALHRGGIALADCHVKNLLVQRREALPPKLWLIDLDGSRTVSGNLPEQRAVADICRLWKSAEKHAAVREVLTRAQQVRFLRAYWGASASALTLRKSAAFLKLLTWHRRRYARAAYAE